MVPFLRMGTLVLSRRNPLRSTSHKPVRDRRKYVSLPAASWLASVDHVVVACCVCVCVGVCAPQGGGGGASRRAPASEPACLPDCLPV